MSGTFLALFENGRIFLHPITEQEPNLFTPSSDAIWIDSGEFVKITIHEPGSTNRKPYDRHAWRWSRLDGQVETDSNRERLIGARGIRGVVSDRQFPLSLFGQQGWRWHGDHVGAWEPLVSS